MWKTSNYKLRGTSSPFNKEKKVIDLISFRLIRYLSNNRVFQDVFKVVFMSNIFASNFAKFQFNTKHPRLYKIELCKRACLFETKERMIFDLLGNRI